MIIKSDIIVNIIRSDAEKKWHIIYCGSNDNS